MSTDAQADTRTVHQRMVAIIDELPAIGKNQRNEQQKFNFRGHDDVLNALTPLLAKHGVVVIPRVVERVTDQRHTKSGSIMYEVNLHIEYTFYGAAGDSITGSAWGEGTDMGDKATMKAGTMAFKAMLNQSFAINTEEGAAHDTDKSTVEETVRNEPESKPPRTGAEVKERLAELLGADEAEVWLEQVAEYASGKSLSPTGLQRLIGVVTDLEGLREDFRDFPADDAREKVQAVFAGRFDGAVFPGPAWATSGVTQ